MFFYLLSTSRRIRNLSSIAAIPLLTSACVILSSCELDSSSNSNSDSQGPGIDHATSDIDSHFTVPVFYKATIRQEHRVFPLGGVIPLTFDYSKETSTGNASGGVGNVGPETVLDRLQMDHVGVPKRMRLVIHRPDGSESEVHKSRKNESMRGDGDSLPVPTDELFPLQKDTVVRMVYDLNELFDLDTPGEYHASVEYYTNTRVQLAEISFRLVSVEVLQDLPVSGLVEYPEQLKPLLSNAIRFRCDLQNSVSIAPDGEHQFIIIKNLRVAEQPGEGFHFFRVPGGTRVVEHAVDIHRQLWLKLRVADQTALVVVDLVEGFVRNVVGWSNDDLVFGHSPANTVWRGLLVFAGKRGTPLQSTLSITAADTRWDARLTK